MSRSLRILLALGALVALPAQAQIYWQPPDLSGAPMLEPEVGYGVILPKATAAENQATLVWSLRSALNVGALQCNFEPTLMTTNNYNAMLTNHRDELAAAYATLNAYFKRTTKTVAAAQKAFDAYNLKIYSSFSAVTGQLAFCTVVGRVSSQAIFAPRGQLITVAQKRLRELYNTIKIRSGEQQFRRWQVNGRPRMPVLEDRCWKGKTYTQSCGVAN